MCGIVGLWNLDGAPIDEAMLSSFADSLAHRGPDGRGTFVDDNAGLGLGHRRLAILDISPTGHQPMSYGDGRYWITHNGEIYNFIELRDELMGLGHRFVSDSDTEVILASYAQWGKRCLLKFNGMWAFAVWDSPDSARGHTKTHYKRMVSVEAISVGLTALLDMNERARFEPATNIPWQRTTTIQLQRS